MRHVLKPRLPLRTVILVAVAAGLVWLSGSFFRALQVEALTAELPKANFDLVDDTSKYVYLSDLALDTTHRSSVGWGHYCLIRQAVVEKLLSVMKGT